MISKELLSEVLGIKINDVEVSNDLKDRPDVYFNMYEDSINIYELAHKCKEWALSKDINSIDIYVFKDCVELEISCDCPNGEGGCSLYICTVDTEREAIFKACQWILEHRNEV